jgi:hypothetical protein
MKNIFILLVVLSVFSCQKVVDINPPTGSTKVIVQGYLYADSNAVVVVTKSTDYLSTTKPPSIGTAVVTLSDENGNSEVLTWNPILQQYESVTMVGAVNNTYTLKVVLEGETYTSTSILPFLQPVDSITVTYEAANAFQKAGYYMKLYGTVSTTVSSYYLFKGYANDSLLNGPTDINYADNKFLEGNLGGLNMGYVYEPGQLATLKIYSLTNPAYQFYNAASIQLNNDGGFFSTPPANVPSMFDNGAVGLFQCSSVQVLTTMVVAQ